MKRIQKRKEKRKIFHRFLNSIEKIGNGLPHPITLFALFALAVVLLSAVCAFFDVSAVGETINPATMELEKHTVSAVSLLTREGLSYMLTSAISNFTSFAPLGVVLVTMLGVGCAEGSGYLSALIRRAILSTPRGIVTPMLVFLGVMSNIASDVGYVVLIPIGAVIFKAYGRHPIAGLAAAFAGVSGGFSANLLIGTIDPMLAGISTEASHIVDPFYTVQATDNWFFMIVSTFWIVAIGTFVTDRIVEPRLKVQDARGPDSISREMDPMERKALRWANRTLFAILFLIVICCIPANSFLRNPQTGSLTENAPLIDGFIPLIAILFLVPSIVFGYITQKYKSEKDICSQMSENMSSMGSYIALSFFAAQFISYFSYTKLGTIFALKGAEWLGSVGMPGPILMVLFILFSALINLVMGSASAKWTILAPVFVPMFMLLGYSPELTQAAYRIGDSCTNLITPLMAYFSMIVVFAKKYDHSSGIGTIISTMVPYSLFFLLGWSVLLIIWMLLGLPLGPGASLLL